MEHNLKIISSLILASFLAGCANHELEPQQMHATDVEKQAANVAYVNCLIPYATRLDDQKSDAKTIAQAMKGACPAELERIYETMSRGENNAVKQMMRQRLASVEESSALQVVLDTRHSLNK